MKLDSDKAMYQCISTVKYTLTPHNNGTQRVPLQHRRYSINLSVNVLCVLYCLCLTWKRPDSTVSNTRISTWRARHFAVHKFARKSGLGGMKPTHTSKLNWNKRRQTEGTWRTTGALRKSAPTLLHCGLLGYATVWSRMWLTTYFQPLRLRQNIPAKCFVCNLPYCTVLWRTYNANIHSPEIPRSHIQQFYSLLKSLYFYPPFNTVMFNKPREKR